MSKLVKQLDLTIEGLGISLGADDAYWEPIEASIRVLTTIRNLVGNIEGITDSEFEEMIKTALDGK